MAEPEGDKERNLLPILTGFAVVNLV
jgi:hypothetical protein